MAVPLDQPVLVVGPVPRNAKGWASPGQADKSAIDVTAALYRNPVNAAVRRIRRTGIVVYAPLRNLAPRSGRPFALDCEQHILQPVAEQANLLHDGIGGVDGGKAGGFYPVGIVDVLQREKAEKFRDIVLEAARQGRAVAGGVADPRGAAEQGAFLRVARKTRRARRSGLRLASGFIGIGLVMCSP